MQDTANGKESDTAASSNARQRPDVTRNKGFAETHREMINTAVRLISEKGVDALSVAAVARSMGVNRTTVYYHFENRDALLDAVKAWSSDQLVKGLCLDAPRPERIDHVSRFVLQNPQLMKLWIDDFVSPGDIRKRYPSWDKLVGCIRRQFGEQFPEEQIDAEVCCIIMLTSAFIGPRVFKNSICPEESIERVVQRFRIETERQLRFYALDHRHS